MLQVTDAFDDGMAYKVVSRGSNLASLPSVHDCFPSPSPGSLYGYMIITSLKWEVDAIDLLSFTLSNFWWRTSLRKQRPFSALLYTPRKQFSKRVKLLGRNLKPKKASALEGLWRTGQFRIIKIHFQLSPDFCATGGVKSNRTSYAQLSICFPYG